MQRFTSIAALTAMLLTAAACGDDSSSSSASTSPDTTAAVQTTAGVETTAAESTMPPDAPKAIVSLSPTATEMLFAIGAGDQIIAVDDQSNFPAEALDKPHDLSGFTPNVEAIAALQPDLVIMQDATVQEQLEALDITVFIGAAPTTFDGVYAQIEQLGAATGHVGDAAELVSNMQADIEAAIAAAPKPDNGTDDALAIYHELDGTFYSATSDTFIGQVYALFGLTNIADEAQPGNPYPQLNAEYIVQQDPALIFLADTKCCGESPETVAARPGWDAIAAVKNGGVVAIDDDIASRWGPRLVDFVNAVSDALAKVPTGA